jgi:membrane-bound inhibitor of C-type lysozyme
MDELNELRSQADKIRTEAAKMTETQTMILMMRQREEDYKAQIQSLTIRVKTLEEELHSRIIDSEEVHQ